MLKEILKLENELGFEGEYDICDGIIRRYEAEPSDELLSVLNILTEDYYTDIDIDGIDTILIQIKDNYDLIISTWTDDEEINDSILVKLNGNYDVIKYLLMAMRIKY